MQGAAVILLAERTVAAVGAMTGLALGAVALSPGHVTHARPVAACFDIYFHSTPC